MPVDWSRRYGPFLGTYSTFIALNSPAVFDYEVNPKTDLLVVRMGRDASEAFSALQRLLDKNGGKPVFPENKDDFIIQDEQYAKLCRVTDMIDKYRIAGSKVILDAARSRVVQLIRQNPTGFPTNKGRKYLSDAGVPPIPLEWFSDLVVVTDNEGIFLRKCPVVNTGPLDPDVTRKCIQIIKERIEHGHPSISVKLLAQRICLGVSETFQLTRNCGSLMYTPGMAYPCEYLEGMVEGYVSPATITKYHRDVELASLSPFQHVLVLVEKTVESSQDNRIPTEHVMAWCASLDIKPRLLWQCLRDKIFWSSNESDLQILLRSRSGKTQHPNPFMSGEFPSDISQMIKNEIRKLGRYCTVDKLVSSLHWGKQSDNVKKFGPLRTVISRLPDIWYDPFFLYSRAAIDDFVVWPDEGEDESEQTRQLREASNMKFVTSANFASSLVYYLSTSGCEYYPLAQAQESLTQAGLEGSDIYKFFHLFVPSDIVYLRKSTEKDELIAITEGSPEWTIVECLRRSTRKAVPYDALLKGLISCEKFDIDEIDKIRRTLTVFCGDMRNCDPSHIISRYCFYNPGVIVLKTLATEFLAVELPDIKYPSPSNFKVKKLADVDDSGVIESDTTQIEQLHPDLPKWCVPDAIVLCSTRDDQEYYIIKADDGRVRIGSILNESEVLDVPLDVLGPRTVKISDRVMVIGGVYKGSVYRVVGVSGLEASVQISKFEFKSIPVKDLICLK
jgi:hypothetical protein